MLDGELLEIVEGALAPLGAAVEAGEEYHAPALDILRYVARPTRLGRIPWLGRALGVVAVVRQPVDVTAIEPGYGNLLQRVGLATNGRFGLRHGPTIGLTAVVLTPEPIAPGEEEALQRTLTRARRHRVVPFGLFRLNLGQTAMSFALVRGPADVFPEGEALADAFSRHFRRHVALWEG